MKCGQSIKDFISALNATRKNAKTVDVTKKRIERYLSWVEDKERSKNLPMEFESEREITTPVENEHIQAGAGRKRLDENGEKRSEKFMIYFTPSLISDLRDWCSLKRISCASYIIDLIQTDIDSKRDKIELFRKLSNEA